MKTLKLTLILLTLNILSFAQNAPFYMSYQAIVRDNNNQVVQNTQVGVRISILTNSPQGDTAYAETHTVTTNINGLLDLAIGGGTQVFGSYAYKYIPWGDVNFYLKTEIDLNGGTNYTISSTSKMMSVPHSNYSHWSSALVGWASYYLGGYQLVGNDQVFIFISYLSMNKVMMTFGLDLPLFGNATPDLISFPTQYSGQHYEGTPCYVSGTAILNEDLLTVTLTSVCDGTNTYTYTFQRIQ